MFLEGIQEFCFFSIIKTLRRVQARKQELENMLQEMEQRLQESADQHNRWDNERKQFDQRLRDTSEQ